MNCCNRQPRPARPPAAFLTTLAALGLSLLGLGLSGCDSGSSSPPTAPRAPAGSMARPLDPALGADLHAASLKAPLPPAPKPTGPLPDDAKCVTPVCHAAFASAPRIHGPVGAQACNACHGNDVGGHRYPLLRLGDATCTFCHSVTGTARHEHKALTTGGCLACHQPHVSTAKFLLRGIDVQQVCTRCHPQPLRHFAHEPFAFGQCTLCHQPHQSDFAHLQRGGEGPEHCFSCHGDLKARMTSRDNTVHPPAAKDCTTCHQTHTSDIRRLLKAEAKELCLSCHKDMAQRLAAAAVTHDATTVGNGCANCHDPHAAPDKQLLSQRSDRLCMQCHDKPVKAHDGRTIPDFRPVLARKFLHGPVAAGNCGACHDAHASTNDRLLTAAFPRNFYAPFQLDNYALCFKCHSKDLALSAQTATLTNFRDGKTNLHFVHVNRAEKGRTCKTCHDVHGSDLPNHLADSVPFEGSNWAMPIGFQKADDGGSCAPGCHEPKTYRRGNPLASAPLSDHRGAP